MTSEISISSNDSSVQGVGGLPTHGNSESSILPITGHKLNGLNYLQWSQSVFMFISGKGKENYLTGTIETPSKDDPNYKKWNSENHMVMSWLINTMNLEIGQNFMFYGTAKEIWENVKETCSDNENTSELFEIKDQEFKILVSSALAAYGTNYKGCDNQPHKGRPWCDHCRRPRHIKEKYWKIHGKPADWKPRKPQPENCGYVATTEEKPISEDVVFSKEQLELLQNMFNQAQINPPVIGSGTIAQKACSNNYKVRIADGSLSTVSGMGSIVISPSITLDYVLLVPSLSCNLLSISKLTKDLKCVANFFPTHCIFQDQDSGKMIGNAKECAGLYLLKDGNLVNETRTDQCISNSVLGKLDPKAVKCVFIGYSSSKKGYKCYSPEKKKVYNTMDVTFFENQSFYPKTSIQGENSATSKDEYQFWHLYNESTDSFPLISHINPENNTESSSQEDKSPPNFHAQNTGKWKNLVYSRKPRDNEVEHPILLEPYQDPNPSTVPAESDWAGSITDRRFTSGYCTYVWGNLVTWRSKKQSVVSRNSAEAEFRAIALSICEGMWLKRLLEELKITCEGSIKVFCDNQASINIAKNHVHHDRTKHVEIDRHFIREKIEGGIIQMVYTPSSHQTADILTKALPKGNFDNLNSKLGMINIYSQLEGE
ncbi:hypothetical protein RJ639_002285 [Escallonia herrerae]|uniref:Uncharacterized protein n=1 Tax=Escallonia herrerae TaxID=1293975 RepID=A0AA88X8J6_9ASTE|nr:hypothetical protein RJ639_002285 [Escallonia herrerae]